MKGGAPFQYTRRRGAPTAEAYAITQGPTLDHLRRRPPMIRTSRPRPLSPTLPVLPPVSPLFSLPDSPLDEPPASPLPPDSPIEPPAPPAAPTVAGQKRPKGSRSGYLLFVKQTRPIVKEDLGRATPQEIIKEVGRRWQMLSAEEKAQYKTRADQRPAVPRQPKTSQKTKIDPFTGEEVTRYELKMRKKADKYNRENRKKVMRVLKKAPKTYLRRASSKLKKMFRGKPGHWKTDNPLRSLADSLNMIQSNCNVLETFKVTNLLTHRDRAKFMEN